MAPYFFWPALFAIGAGDGGLPLSCACHLSWAMDVCMPEGLRGWVASLHPPMTDLKLSRDEENDILANLLPLR